MLQAIECLLAKKQIDLPDTVDIFSVAELFLFSFFSFFSVDLGD